MNIVDSDAFLDLPLSAQCLYFHLNMRADDDGFVSNARRICKLISASTDDLKLLVAKRFILIVNEDGVIVIKHWRMHNTIRKDRYTPTVYQEELNRLILKDNASYSDGNHLATIWQPSGNPDIGLDIGLDLDKDSKGKTSRFTPPTLEEVTNYCKERKNNVDPQRFIDFYESKGWMIGKNKMKDWKAAVRNWEKTERKSKTPDFTAEEMEVQEVNIDALRKKMFGGERKC